VLSARLPQTTLTSLLALSVLQRVRRALRTTVIVQQWRGANVRYVGCPLVGSVALKRSSSYGAGRALSAVGVHDACGRRM
jgi:hypothetical protein